MARSHEPIYEKPHRLARERYRGQVILAFTGCVEEKRPLFADAAAVTSSVERLTNACDKYSCNVLIYCFMPEHSHLITRGRSMAADAWKAMVAFKQQIGYWIAQNRPSFKFQKDFYDHLIRADEDLVAQIRYVAQNPVRRGLVKHWFEYPHTGAIGVSLLDVLRDTAIE
jgi:REP element-mobilizing transposase RayT